MDGADTLEHNYPQPRPADARIILIDIVCPGDCCPFLAVGLNLPLAPHASALQPEPWPRATA